MYMSHSTQVGSLDEGTKLWKVQLYLLLSITELNFSKSGHRPASTGGPLRDSAAAPLPTELDDARAELLHRARTVAMNRNLHEHQIGTEKRPGTCKKNANGIEDDIGTVSCWTTSPTGYSRWWKASKSSY